MSRNSWVLIDTETTGLTAPVFVVDLAAQKMSGWEPVGPVFRKMINHGVNIPAEAARINGYTREVLERDGEPPLDVYDAFARFVGDLPISSYNLDFDLQKVLLPEWRRLGIDPIGREGFCVLRLAQRLLDPTPAGNCKLQTLRQYYRLPERGAHTAAGDVATVVDLLGRILAPIADSRGIEGLAAISAYLEEEWFPTRIAFGRFKGVDYRDARHDPALHSWLVWLSESGNARSARMGLWYLNNLSKEDPAPLSAVSEPPSGDQSPAGGGGPGLVIYRDIQRDELDRLIERARARLAAVEAEYTRERNAVDVVQNQLFALLKDNYRARDALALKRDYRQRYLDSLLRAGEDEAEQVDEEFERAQAEQEHHYEEAERVSQNVRTLSDEDQAELKDIWRKLVRVFHPDRFLNDPKKHEAYTQVTALINESRDRGDIELLREIARDPAAFVMKQGWTALDFGDERDLARLRRLYAALQNEIIVVLEAINSLRESPQYEMMALSVKWPDYIEKTAADLAARLDEEVAALRVEVEQLETEIASLLET